MCALSTFGKNKQTNKQLQWKGGAQGHSSFWGTASEKATRPQEWEEMFHYFLEIWKGKENGFILQTGYFY